MRNYHLSMLLLSLPALTLPCSFIISLMSESVQEKIEDLVARAYPSLRAGEPYHPGRHPEFTDEKLLGGTSATGKPDFGKRIIGWDAPIDGKPDASATAKANARLEEINQWINLYQSGANRHPLTQLVRSLADAGVTSEIAARWAAFYRLEHRDSVAYATAGKISGPNTTAAARAELMTRIAEILEVYLPLERQ